MKKLLAFLLLMQSYSLLLAMEAGSQSHVTIPVTVITADLHTLLKNNDKDFFNKYYQWISSVDATQITHFKTDVLNYQNDLNNQQVMNQKKLKIWRKAQYASWAGFAFGLVNMCLSAFCPEPEENKICIPTYLTVSGCVALSGGTLIPVCDKQKIKYQALIEKNDAILAKISAIQN